MPRTLTIEGESVLACTIGLSTDSEGDDGAKGLRAGAVQSDVNIISDTGYEIL